MTERKSRGRLLVIDDEAATRRLLKLNLEEEGFEVITANNGEQGFQKAVAELPEVILLDI